MNWYYQRRWIHAYRRARNEYERHKYAGHSATFSAVYPSHLCFDCTDCPWIEGGR